MPDPNLINVVDAEGTERWASRTAKHVVDGLADGTLVEAGSKQKAKPKPTEDDAPVTGEGAPDAAPDAPTGDGKNTRKSAR